jgi:hypothetical protein
VIRRGLPPRIQLISLPGALGGVVDNVIRACLAQPIQRAPHFPGRAPFRLDSATGPTATRPAAAVEGSRGPYGSLRRGRVPPGLQALLGAPFRAVIPNDSTVERHGVRVTVRSVRREGQAVRLSYALEHVACREPGGPLVFMHPVTGVKVYLWDAAGRLVAEDTAWEKEFMPEPVADWKMGSCPPPRLLRRQRRASTLLLLATTGGACYDSRPRRGTQPPSAPR